MRRLIAVCRVAALVAALLSAGIASAEPPPAGAPPAGGRTVETKPPDTKPPDTKPGETETKPPDTATLSKDMSALGMFMAADTVVKAVMIGLAFASVLAWTMWLAKSLELAGAKARMRRAMSAIGDARSLAEAGVRLRQRAGPSRALIRAAETELRLSEGVADAAGIKERIASRLARLEIAAGRRMARGTGLLASIGSTAPFVGLFGTVWGIMNSFVGISKAQTTNLAVVAPGIAEALLATAMGLVAAIPAVLIYNHFTRAIAGYRQQVGDAAAEVQRLVSRDLDRGLRPAPDAAAKLKLVTE
jgi:biopolymer transport protein ExbB